LEKGKIPFTEGEFHSGKQADRSHGKGRERTLPIEGQQLRPTAKSLKLLEKREELAGKRGKKLPLNSSQPPYTETKDQDRKRKRDPLEIEECNRLKKKKALQVLQGGRE